MSKQPTTPDPFASIACLPAISADDLTKVAGGAARVTARSGGANSELTAMLTQVTNSIKDLASSKQSGGMDPMMMMMMMMMMVVEEVAARPQHRRRRRPLRLRRSTSRRAFAAAVRAGR